MSKLKILPSVSLIMKEAEGRLNIHENYLKILINKELDYFRKKIISEDTKLKIITYDELAYQFNDPAREFRDGCMNIMQTCNEHPEANKKLLQPKGLKCLENIKLTLRNYQLTEKTLVEQHKRDN